MAVGDAFFTITNRQAWSYTIGASVGTEILVTDIGNSVLDTSMYVHDNQQGYAGPFVLSGRGGSNAGSDVFGYNGIGQGKDKPIIITNEIRLQWRASSSGDPIASDFWITGVILKT